MQLAFGCVVYGTSSARSVSCRPTLVGGLKRLRRDRSRLESEAIVLTRLERVPGLYTRSSLIVVRYVRNVRICEVHVIMYSERCIGLDM